MDGTVLGLFLFATFVGGVVAGLAGFAMSLVVAGIWLHILTPIQTVTLIVGYGLLVQGYGIWKLRHALSWRRVMPFIIGGAVGVPIGAVLLAYINPSHMRTVVGLLLVLYSAYGLARPVIKPVQAKIPADIGVRIRTNQLDQSRLQNQMTMQNQITMMMQNLDMPKFLARAVLGETAFARCICGAEFLNYATALVTQQRGVDVQLSHQDGG